MKKEKIAAGLIIIVMCMACVTVARLCYKPKPIKKLEARYLHRSKGSPRAELWIVEYIDFACTRCAVPRLLLQNYFSKYRGRIFWQTRFCSGADTPGQVMKAFLYAECAAGQDKYWPFEKLLFEKRADWFYAQNPEKFFRDFAKTSGMDLVRLDACAESSKVRSAVLAEAAEASSLGIKSAPAFFVNGKVVTDLEGLENELNAYCEGGK